MSGIPATKIMDSKTGSMQSEIWTFFRRHWFHFLLFPPGALLVTLIHESAHATAVLAQGGTVLEFVWLPTGENWGYVSYDRPALRGFSEFAVSIAPYLLWIFLAAVAVLLSLRRRPYSFFVASTVYLWLFLIPLSDVANAAFPYLGGKSNDLMYAFGRPTLDALLGFSVLCVLALIVGHPLQRRLYRSQALRLRSYLVLCAAVMFVIIGLTVRIF